MAGYKYLGSIALVVDGGGDPTSLNLAQFIVAGEAANVDGPIPAHPGTGGGRSLEISIDNRGGTGDVYLAPPAILPTGAPGPDPPADPYETSPLTAWVVVADDRADISPIDYATWALVARGMPGCSAMITVGYRGQGL